MDTALPSSSMTQSQRSSTAAPSLPRRSRWSLYTTTTDFLSEAWWRVAIVALLGAVLINTVFWLIGFLSEPAADFTRH